MRVYDLTFGSSGCTTIPRVSFVPVRDWYIVLFLTCLNQAIIEVAQLRRPAGLASTLAISRR